jgi:hypothetical protein
MASLLEELVLMREAAVTTMMTWVGLGEETTEDDYDGDEESGGEFNFSYSRFKTNSLET